MLERWEQTYSKQSDVQGTRVRFALESGLDQSSRPSGVEILAGVDTLVHYNASDEDTEVDGTELENSKDGRIVPYNEDGDI